MEQLADLLTIATSLLLIWDAFFKKTYWGSIPIGLRFLVKFNPFNIFLLFNRHIGDTDLRFYRPEKKFGVFLKAVRFGSALA